MLALLAVGLWRRLRGHYGGPWILDPGSPCERHSIAFSRCPGHPCGPWWLPGVGHDFSCLRCAYTVHLGL